MTKRAICLAGGGPAAGLHIGALEGLSYNGLTFDKKDDVWALSCIGAWVGVIYNQAKKGREIEAINTFFHNIFRDDQSFKSFPVNTIFAPDWAANAEAVWDFMLDPRNYRNAFLPRQIMQSYLYTLRALRRRSTWEYLDEGDFNQWTLNHVLAVNPVTRFLTAMIYNSDVIGLTKLFYPDSKFIRNIDFRHLYERPRGSRDEEPPYIVYNAWNLSRKHLQLFTNKRPPETDYHYKWVDAASLCACSALPYIEQTVEIDGDTYCEGALVDTVNFERLVQDHDLDEIWINRIVDAQQVRKPVNLHDALANLCELFAATVGEDDVRLFKCHLKEPEQYPGPPGEGKKAKEGGADGEAEAATEHPPRRRFTGIVVEIKVDSKINFEWSHSNLERGRYYGRTMADVAYRLYKKFRHCHKPGKVFIIPDDIPEDEIRSELSDLSEEQIAAILVGHPDLKKERHRHDQLKAQLGPTSHR